MTPYRTAALALGGSWAILVPAGKAGRAREALRENDEGVNVVEPEADAGLTSNQRATLRFAIMFGVALLLIALAAAFLGGR